MSTRAKSRPLFWREKRDRVLLDVKMLTAVKNTLRPMMMEFSYKPAVEMAGFNPVETYPVSSMVVYRCNGASSRETIVKIARRQNPEFLDDLRGEWKVLIRMDGCPRIPRFVSYHDHLSGSMISAVTNFLRGAGFEKDAYEALERTYIPGRELFPGERISCTREQAELMEVMKAFHSEGIAKFSVRNRNLVVTEDSKVHFIDFGGMIFREETSGDRFDEVKETDLKNIEDIFD